MRKELWNFLEYPETSIGAQALAFVSLLMVCISTVTFIIGTNYEGEQEKQLRISINANNLTIMEEDIEKDSEWNIIEIIDNTAVIFFSIEYFIRKSPTLNSNEIYLFIWYTFLFCNVSREKRLRNLYLVHLP